MSTKKALLLIFALALLLRAFPLFMGSMTGPDPWFHARMSEMVVSGQAIPELDSLSMQGRYYSYAPLFHAFIASTSIFSGIPVLPLTPILPVIYGAMAVFLAFVFAKRFFGSNSIALFAALAIAVMPLHLMRTAAYARPDSLTLLIVPAILYLVYTKRFAAALPITIALAVLHPLSALYLFSFLVIWMIVARLKRLEFDFCKTFLLVLVGVLVWLIWLYSLPYSFTDYVSAVSLESGENTKPLWLGLFTFFTFSWIFLLIGLSRLKLRKNMFLAAWLFFSFLYGAFSVRLAIFLSIPATIVASLGFGFVLEKTRKATPVLFLLLFLLASIVVFNEASETAWFVAPAERNAMQWLQNTPQDSVIGSIWDRGHPLTYLSKRAVMIDGYFEFAPELDRRNESMKTLIASSDCNKLSFEAAQWGLDFFYVHFTAIESQTMRHGLLEADCDFISRVYESDYAIVLAFN